MPKLSKFQTVPLKTTGSSYQNDSIPISAQRSYHLYPEITPDGITPAALKRWPGLGIYNINSTSTPCKFLYYWNGKFYTSYNNRFYEFTSSTATGSDGFLEITGTATDIGGMNGSNDIFSVADNGSIMVIATGSSLYTYDGTTLATESSAPTNPFFVQFNNERFLVSSTDGATYVSDVLTTNFDSANRFFARAKPDDFSGTYIFNQVAYAFSEFSIEPWSDVSVGAPPYSRLSEGIVDTIGTFSIDSVTNTENYMYFIGSDGVAYRVSTFLAEPISTTAISKHFRGLSYDKVKADAFVYDGQHFIVFTFTTDLETWVYSETTGSWFEIGDGDTGYKGFAFIQGQLNRIYCASYTDGSIYYLRDDYFLNPTSFMEFERVIPCVSGDDFGEPQNLLEMSKMYISVETGGALDPSKYPSTAATYNNPKLVVTPSFDGGYTWDKSNNLELGTRGDYTKKVELHLMKQFRRAAFRFRVTEPLEKFAIYSVGIDIRKAGS